MYNAREDKNQEKQKESRIVVIPERILKNQKLRPSAKLVYARINYFEEFWEDSKTTAEYLGLKTYTVQEDKRRLEACGEIIEIANTGRGKRYMTCSKIGELLAGSDEKLSDEKRARLLKLKEICEARLKKSKTSQKTKSDLVTEKTGESSQIAKSEFVNCEVSVCETRDIGKKEVRMRGGVLSSKEDNGETPKNASFQPEDFGEKAKSSKQKKVNRKTTNPLKGNPKEKKVPQKEKSTDGQEKSLVKADSRVLDEGGRVVGGNVLVEKAYALWEEVLGQPCKRDKWNSQAAWNMMRAKAKGEQWLKGMLIVVRECKKDPKADFRARNIANLADLQRNWEYAMDWYRQQVSIQQESNIIRLDF